MCGLVGMIGATEVCWSLYEVSNVQQHRGQDAAGIATYDGSRCHIHTGIGLARDIYNDEIMGRLRGNAGIAHVRYPTAGSRDDPLLAQPFYVNYPFGIFLGHNGNLTNSQDLKKDLVEGHLCHINTDSDSEVLLNIFAQALHAHCTKHGAMTNPAEAVFYAISQVHQKCRGAYAAVLLLSGYGLVGFRDPNGIRPLVFGKKGTGSTAHYMFSSESVALDAMDFELLRDVAPGEGIFVEYDSLQVHKRQCSEHYQLVPCIFEHVYLARPDSIMDGVPLYRARLNQGEYLARKILREHPDHDIDVVIPVPDTGRVAAQMISQILKIKVREGLMKNRYVGRTFIMPKQSMRINQVRRKLNPIESEFRNKNVLLVDDSIVRGTTSKQLVDLARLAGARKVYFASAAPPVRFPNYYGIDIPSVDELIATNRDLQAIQESIGANWLVYQDLEDLIRASQDINPDIRRFECSVFDGHYITEEESTIVAESAV